MGKPRKPPITNAEGIEKLEQAGIIAYRNLEDKSCEFSRRMVKKQLGYSWRWRNTQPEYQESFMIPVDLWKKYVASTYRLQIKKGTMVRLRDRTTRQRDRSNFNQDNGDTFDWKHLGMGSGKRYMTDKVKEIAIKHLHIDQNAFDPNAGDWLKQNTKARILASMNQALYIGNKRYASNLIDAAQKAEYYRKNGIVDQTKPKWWSDDNRQFTAFNFVKYTELKRDGLLGPKKIINGWVTEAFVHFMHPTWETKRETRYEVLFETGARGVFTGDYLDKVFDVDYDADDVMMLGCRHQQDLTRCRFCTHIGVHLPDQECEQSCTMNPHNHCRTLWDYTNLMETTWGRAKEFEDDNEYGF